MFAFPRIFNFRLLAALSLVGVLSTAAYGFAAANVVPESGAGDGSGTISGYTVSSVTYTLNGTNPANLDSVSFSLASTSGSAGAPTAVKVKLVSSGSTWYGCTAPVAPSTTWTCTTTGATAASADQLRVIAAQ